MGTIGAKIIGTEGTMPTGFNVETGSKLSPKLLSYAPILLKFLKTEREQRGRGPGNSLLSIEIESHLSTFGRDVKGSDVRAMVNYLRRNKYPVGSNADGYFLAINRQELDFTIQHMQERISSIRAALNGLEGSFDDQEEVLL